KTLNFSGHFVEIRFSDVNRESLDHLSGAGRLHNKSSHPDRLRVESHRSCFRVPLNFCELSESSVEFNLRGSVIDFFIEVNTDRQIDVFNVRVVLLRKDLKRVQHGGSQDQHSENMF